MATQEAYFVPRSEILAWINSTLGLRLTKVEETANGAVACQLLDCLYPNTVPMKKVDFNAKNDYDMINNYKVMQDVFNKLGVDKHVDVSKLIKGRPLDNTEFMQWFKGYWDKATGGMIITDYDAVARRQQCKTGGVKGSDAAGTPASKSAGAQAGALPQRRVPASYAGKATTPPPPAASRSKRSLISSSAHFSDADAIEQLQEEVASWRSLAETCNKEKEFYYSKLRSIELLCNSPVVSGNPIAKAVEGILYAGTAEEGEDALSKALKELDVQGEGEEQQLQEQSEEQQIQAAAAAAEEEALHHHLAAEQSAASRRSSRASEHQQHYGVEAAAAY